MSRQKSWVQVPFFPRIDAYLLFVRESSSPKKQGKKHSLSHLEYRRQPFLAPILFSSLEWTIVPLWTGEESPAQRKGGTEPGSKESNSLPNTTEEREFYKEKGTIRTHFELEACILFPVCSSYKRRQFVLFPDPLSSSFPEGGNGGV